MNLGYRASEKLDFIFGYKVLDMAYSDYSGDLNINDATMALGIKTYF